MQHLTIKNVFLAIVALNLLSAASTIHLGGTFKEAAPPVAKIVPPSVASPASDPGMIAHMVPGDAPPARAELPAVHQKRAMDLPTTKVRPQPVRVAPSKVPGTEWMFFLIAAAMALYVRYLMGKAVVHASGQVLEIARRAANALTGVAAGKPSATASTFAKTAAMSPPAPVLQQKTSMPPKTQRPRTATVVRPSRWPFAA
jgi:hypothetical protein